ncbi:MAG: hypothetical protein NC417_00115 [Candidatus Gastranaerophilales bacterium]|nr:hypothetical protein [Candidatus Gastranaerophilales bacterium]
MKRFRMMAGIALACVIAAMGTACGALPGEIQEEAKAAPVCMESAPVVDYTVPSLTPNILVDQNGYQAQGKKTVVIKGAELPDSFRLVECETGEIVYIGPVEGNIYNEELGLYTGYVDFVDYLGKQGEQYYIECDYIGRSYSFSVSETAYWDLFDELCQEICDECESGEVLIDDVLTLLTVYERYGDIFPDEDENEIPDVMEVLQEWSEDFDHKQVDVGQASLYAAALAKFSYLYQKYDLPYATECLQWASALFAQTQNTAQKDAESFFALTELYRATGLYTYHSQIVEYVSYFENTRNYLDEPGYLNGAMTYMVTRQKVDVKLCNLLMEQLLKKGEEISEHHGETLSPVSAVNDGEAELLKQTELLSAANYVLNSYQYDYIQEEFLHYLMGSNLQSVRFYPTNETRGNYLLILAQLASMQAYRPASEA